MQIVDTETGTVVAGFAPGRQEETDFIQDVCRRVEAKGVGLTKSAAHVVADVRDALTDALRALKKQV